MADTVQFDLVSPERLLVSVEASEIEIPSGEGDITAMPNHSPLITPLRPGVLTVTSEKGTDAYVVTGGFAEISQTSISVLAEQAIPSADFTREQHDAMVKEATDAMEKAREIHENDTAPVDEAAKLLSDVEAIADKIGLNAR